MSERVLFLPEGYVENDPEEVAGDPGSGFWGEAAEVVHRRSIRHQDAVYRLAARIVPAGAAVVLDVGCGTGDQLARHLTTAAPRVVGVDQPSAIALARASHPGLEWVAADLRADATWASLFELRPDVTICADVIEHVDDPVSLLTRLHTLIGPRGRLVLSTPDRARVEDQPRLGPPRNAHHVREWALDEMTALLRANGFTIHRARHVLPRHFGLTPLDVKIVTWRALHLRAVPARRHTMVFELTRS